MKKDIKFNYDDSYGQLIGVVRGLLQTYFLKTFEENGIKITPVQWGLLNRLWEEDGIPQIELVNKTLKQKGNVTRLLDGMVKLNWIKRVPSPTDRRVFLIYLTDKGKELQSTLPPIASKILKTVSENISKEELSVFKEVLKQMKINLLNNLNKYE